MKKVKFPNVDLTLMLKTKDVCKNKDTRTCADYYKPEEIYKLLSITDKYELGGLYSPKHGFIIDPHVTYFDTKEDRAYTTLNVNSNTCIVWHSHPFDHKATSYPSIEDLDMCRMYPKLIFLLLSKKGIYVMSSLESYIGIDLIVSYYKNMQPETSGCEWNYSEIEQSFLNNRGYTNDNIKKHGLFVYLIQHQHINKKLLNKVILDAYQRKEKSLHQHQIIKSLNDV